MATTTYSLSVKAINGSNVTRSWTFSPAKSEVSVTAVNSFVSTAKTIYGDSELDISSAKLTEKTVTNLLDE